MTKNIPLKMMLVPDRLREIDPAWVEALTSSIEEHGLQQPIVVSEAEGGCYQLIAGAHRLAAVQRSGQKTIPAIVHADVSDDQARLIEIDENLMRHELSAFDRMAFIAERRQVWEAIHGKPHGGDRRSKARTENQVAMFATWSGETQKKTGLSGRSIRQVIQIYEALTPETRSVVRGSWLAENGAQLKALAQMGDKNLQTRAAQEMIAQPDRLRTVQQAQDFLERGEVETRPKTPAERKLEALMHAWNSADTTVRTQFLDWAGLRYKQQALRLVESGAE